MITFKKIQFFAFTVILAVAFCLLLSTFHQECQTKRLGIETEAVVDSIPLQPSKRGSKEMFVKVGTEKLRVNLSLQDYNRKRFKPGEAVMVKYHAASHYAILNGEISDDTLFKLFVGTPFVLLLVWWNWRRAFRGKPGY